MSGRIQRTRPGRPAGRCAGGLASHPLLWSPYPPAVDPYLVARRGRNVSRQRGRTRSATLTALAQPGGRKSAKKQRQAEETREDRQYADTADDAAIAHPQPDPVVALEGLAAADREHPRDLDTTATVVDPANIAAGRRRQRGQYVAGRGHFCEFPRIGRPDIDERGEFAVGGAPQAQLVGCDRGAPVAGL